MRFLCDWTGLARGARVLDVPCGTGRHLPLLGRRELAVWGVELSLDYLRQARAAAGPAIRLLRGDMRFLPFPDASFEAVFMLFTSFGYFGDEENLELLRELARVLRPDGALVIEVINRDAVARATVSRMTTPRPGGGMLEESYVLDPVSGTLTHTVLMTHADGAPPRRFELAVNVYNAT